MVATLVSSCQAPDSAKEQQVKQCPQQPPLMLTNDGVKEVDLAAKPMVESGDIGPETTIGYFFAGKQGQKLLYQTDQDLCIWFYGPDNKLINDSNIDKNGNYILQISSRQGRQNFQLELSLDSSQIRSSPENFISQYYQEINDTRYSSAWELLSDEFRKISSKDSSTAYQDYQNWWNKVKVVQLLEVREIRQNEDSALVKVRIRYLMNDGRLIDDKKSFIYLLWNKDINSWQIHRKSSS
ncbi:hypothetical protein IQE94_13220 [Synechocystis sp. PCC 7339]|uniref:hypothetical protein n=1 Tax=Synechocystis sp. PCC 7339 TaxID=2782213 RepID=UPI001CBD6D0A|nr:hypothetical protein [Synechocystis sp. PCC 7339]UAJ72057.1 hypothetical protein IQE94_13220 [Synechocystis sp. PCC 7339]